MARWLNASAKSGAALDEVVEGGDGLLGVAQPEDAIQLVAVGGTLAAEPQRPHRLGREAGDLVLLVVEPVGEERR